MPTEELDRALTAALARVDEPDVEAARDRLHRRIRRRRMMKSLAILPVLAAVVAVSIVAASKSTTSQRVVTTPAPDGPLPVKMIPGPPGWQAVDYGNARAWVPGDWHVLFPGASECQVLANRVLINPQPGKCLQQIPATASFLMIGPLSSSNPGNSSTRRVNGYLVVERSDGSYSVPALSVQLTIAGPLTHAILATLGPSSRAAVLTAGSAPRAPTSWQMITYGGLTFRVPPGWPTRDGTTFFAGCGGALFPSPEVVVDRPHVFTDCVITGDTPAFQPSDGIWLVAQSGASSYGPDTTTLLTTPGGLRVSELIDLPDNNFEVTLYATPLPGKQVEIDLGLGVDPTIARTILYSLSMSTASSATTTVPPQPTGPPPACHASNLTATYDWQGATGSLLGSVRLTNHGPTTCSLSAYRGIKVIGRDGTVLPVRDLVEPPTSAPPVLLGVTGTATVNVQWQEWCEATNPTPVTLAITLPDGSVVTATNDGQNGLNQTPRCDVPNLPSTLYDGPVRPG